MRWIHSDTLDISTQLLGAFAPPRRTVADGAEASGVGVHGGRPVTIRLAPAECGDGVVFIRTDLPGAPRVRVRPESVNIASLRRMTGLAEKGAEVGMTEHLLSACAGLGVTDLMVELNAPELPIFDGSALPYAELLRGAGIRDLAGRAEFIRIDEPIVVSDGNAEIVAVPADSPRFTYFLELREHGMPDQQATFHPATGDYLREIAPARTFCFWDDIEKLRAAGLIKGGSLDCAVVVRDGGPHESQWRLEAELARHKLLDLMGDLAVLGAPMAAMISARRSGHALNQAFAAEVWRRQLQASPATSNPS